MEGDLQAEEENKYSMAAMIRNLISDFGMQMEY
jgi:hypothetical protein